MAENKIEELQELISQYVGPGKYITETQIRSLIAPGENYFSNMLEVNLTLKNQADGKEEPFHAVAKCMLKFNEGMPGPGQFTYLSEIAFYNEMIPIIETFRKEEGVKGIMDIFPKLYAFRPNLHSKNDEVDDNAVILLENLKVEGNTYSIKTNFYCNLITCFL